MRIFFLILAISTALPLPASAQHFQSGGQFSNHDRRVLVGLTVPLGGGGSRIERQPRVELVVDQRRRDADGFEIREVTNLSEKRSSRLGLTLSKKPELMLNGRMISFDDNRTNLSDGALIGIGVGIVLIGGVLLIDSVIDRSKCCE